MRTPRPRTSQLLAATILVLAVFAVAPPVPVLSPALCLAVLLTTGELAVRALVREPLAAGARFGLAAAAGLMSLPLVALALHVLGVRIEARWLAAGIALLAAGLGALGEKHPVLASPPHPRNWVGRVEQTGTTVSSRLSTGRPLGRLSPNLVALVVPAVLALVVGGTATLVYQRLPHPAQPGYTSLALAGWATGIDEPIAFPAAGLEVPVQISSAGEPPARGRLLVKVGDRVTGPGTPVTIADGTRSVQVHVPAPPDGCLHPIRISLGPISTIFYGRGPGPAWLPAALAGVGRSASVSGRAAGGASVGAGGRAGAGASAGSVPDASGPAGAGASAGGVADASGRVVAGEADGAGEPAGRVEAGRVPC